MPVEVDVVASNAGVRPERGVSAIAIASIAIAELHRGGWHGLVQKGKSSGTSNVGFIHAGEATNVVTDRAVLKVEARSHDPKFRQKLIGEIEKAFKSAAKEVKNVDGKLTHRLPKANRPLDTIPRNDIDFSSCESRSDGE